MEIIIRVDKFDDNFNTHEVVRVKPGGVATTQMFRGSLDQCRLVAMPYVLLGYDITQEVDNG